MRLRRTALLALALLGLVQGLRAESEGGAPAPAAGAPSTTVLSPSALAEGGGPQGLVHVGLGLGHAQNWSPSTDRVSWSQASLLLVFDRDPIFPYRPSPSLAWLLELDLGLTERPENKAVASAGMHALWSPWRPEGLRPFLSGGIGGIYTDWQVQDQPLRVNFNPQVGLGVEFSSSWLVTVRVHHLSNAGLVPPNRGVNSVLAMLATYF